MATNEPSPVRGILHMCGDSPGRDNIRLRGYLPTVVHSIGELVHFSIIVQLIWYGSQVIFHHEILTLWKKSVGTKYFFATIEYLSC